jgi:hypothetical protein
VPSIPLSQGSIERMCSRFAKTMRASATLPLSFIASRITAKVATLVVGDDVIGVFVKPLVDLFLGYKFIDIDRSRAFDFYGFQLI